MNGIITTDIFYIAAIEALTGHVPDKLDQFTTATGQHKLVAYYYNSTLIPAVDSLRLSDGKSSISMQTFRNSQILTRKFEMLTDGTNQARFSHFTHLLSKVTLKLLSDIDLETETSLLS